MTTSSVSRIAASGIGLLLLVLAACGGAPARGYGPGGGQGPHRAHDSRAPAWGKRADPADPDVMRVHMIDVGQGLSVLVELPCGALLYDTGGEKNELFDSEKALVAYLDDFFEHRPDLRRTLDLLVISHPHLDHMRNAQAVLSRYTVRNYVDNGQTPPEEEGEMVKAIRRLVEEKRIPHRDVLADAIGPEGEDGPILDPISGCGLAPRDPRIRALWGRVEYEADTFSNDANDHSIVLRLDYGASSVLLLGDIERPAAARMDAKYKDDRSILDVDVFTVPHHGSRNGLVRHFLPSMTPKVALIAAGPYLRDADFTARAFGHPHESTLALLADPEIGIPWRRKEARDVMLGVRGRWEETPEQFRKGRVEAAIYATGWDGSVVVTLDGAGGISVQDAEGREL